MKKIVFGLLLLPVFIFGQKGFVITGKVTGLADSSEVRLINNNSKAEIAKTKASKGQFILKGSVPEAELYSLTFGKAVTANTPPPTYFLYLDNSNISITGDLQKMDKLKVTGSSSHNDFLVFQ